MSLRSKILTLIWIHFLALWPAACTPSATSPSGIHHIDATRAQALIDRHAGSSQLVILDVRTPKEYRQGHIAGAILMDFHRPDFSQRLQQLDTAKTYLIYCHTGYRSGRTVKMIEKMGFQTVYHLKRGIVEWYAEKLPLVRS